MTGELSDTLTTHEAPGPRSPESEHRLRQQGRARTVPQARLLPTRVPLGLLLVPSFMVRPTPAGDLLLVPPAEFLPREVPSTPMHPGPKAHPHPPPHPQRRVLSSVVA